MSDSDTVRSSPFYLINIVIQNTQQHLTQEDVSLPDLKMLYFSLPACRRTL